MEGKIPGAASNRYANSLQTSGRRILQTVLATSERKLLLHTKRAAKKKNLNMILIGEKIQTIQRKLQRFLRKNLVNHTDKLIICYFYEF